MNLISVSALRKYGLVVFLFTLTTTGYCQVETKNNDRIDLAVKKRTVLERFDSDLVISPEKRIKLKIERVAAIQERLQIMDTLDISDRQKRRLLKELYRSPFSDEWNKILADLQFEE